MASTHAVRVPIEFYLDYNCPFSYVASERLARLGERHPVAIHHRFIEVQPDAPASPQRADAGEPDPALLALIREDDLAFTPDYPVTNSRRVLLLAEAVLDNRPAAFPALHRDLFRRHFAEATDIGDAAVLRSLAAEHGVGDLVTPAWETPTYLQRLLGHVEAAAGSGVGGVPALVVGERVFTGAAAVSTLAQALDQQAVSRHH